jgi:type VI secretion system protein ImpH
MATTLGQHDSDVIDKNPTDKSPTPLQAFFQKPFEIGFFQAVRVLRRLLPGRKPVGRFSPPASETARFVAHPSLAFPASEIQELALPPDDHSPATMKVNFMGLSSPQGVLPTPYTELILERAQRKDTALRDFLDLFNHRLISFFYRAWEKHHFFVSYELGEPDSVSPLMMSLLGLGTEGLATRQLVPDQALIFYSGLLTQKPRSAQNLKQLLTDYFHVTVEIEQFVGTWVPLQQIDQTVLDDSESPMQRLGFGAVVGDEVWDQQSTVRVKLGPLTREQYVSFLPREESPAFRDLKAILKFWANNELDFEVQLILQSGQTPAFDFDKEYGGERLLGWTTWITNRPMERDPGEATLYI